MLFVSILLSNFEKIIYVQVVFRLKKTYKKPKYAFEFMKIKGRCGEMYRKININELSSDNKVLIDFKEEITVSKEYDLLDNTIEVEFNGHLKLENDFYILEGDTKLAGKTECSTCLKVLDFTDKFSVFEKFSNKGEGKDDDVWQFIGLDVDISEAIYSNVVLNIPFKLNCNETCKGLCKYCGINLNDSTCDCQPPVDPRFEGLLSLLQENKEV